MIIRSDISTKHVVQFWRCFQEEFDNLSNIIKEIKVTFFLDLLIDNMDLTNYFWLLQANGQTEIVQFPVTWPTSFWASNGANPNGFPAWKTWTIARGKKHPLSNIGKNSCCTSHLISESLEIWEDSITQFRSHFFCHGSWFSFVSWKVSNRAERWAEEKIEHNWARLLFFLKQSIFVILSYNSDLNAVVNVMKNNYFL